MKNSFLFAVTALIFIASPSLAQDTKPAANTKDAKPTADGDKPSLANQATNPAAALIQVQIQNIFTPSTRGASGYANTFIVQPVIPIALSKTGYFQNIITRTTLPILTSANPDGPMTSVTGLGDTTAIAVLAHKGKISKGFGYVWGPLAAMQLPTGTSDRTGKDKYSLGGGVLLMFSKSGLFTNGDTLQFGAFGYNLWSAAGRDSRPNVNTFFMTPILNYHFNKFFGQKGWYMRWSDELQSYDWKASGSDTAAIPVGGALGKVFAIGKHHFNVYLGGNYNAAYRSGISERWNIKLNVTLLLPE